MTSGNEILVRFGSAQGSEPFRVSGWSSTEATETWTVGNRAELRFPTPTRPATYVVTFRMRPLLVLPKLTVQRVRLIANGLQVAEFRIDGRAVRTALIPWSVIAGRPSLDLVLELPDAARPVQLGLSGDDRQLGVAVSSLRLYPDVFEAWQDDGFLTEDDSTPINIQLIARVESMPLHELLLKFESLGQNCEFGLVQRQCQSEPLGLLRFSSTPLPQLLDALDARFEGMGLPDTISVALSSNGREYMVKDSRFGFIYHAWVNAGEMAPEDIVKRESRRVPFLVRKLLEDLEAGEKLFVFKGMGAMPEEEVFPLATAIRRYGPNTLLFVTLSDAEHKGGTVEARAPGFIVGYVDRFAPGDNAHDLLLGQWVKVCREAWRLRIATGARTG